MDWINCTNSAMGFIKKYRYALLVIAAGLLFMLPAKKTAPPAISPLVSESSPGLEENLSHILSQVVGAGEVKVLLTLAQGEETIFEKDTDISADDRRDDTVLVTGTDRSETGLIRQINPPVYRGALILCQGADSPGIRLAIVEAVMDVTGLTSDKITVLKMK